jgi:uncharacterized protein DUF2505
MSTSWTSTYALASSPEVIFGRLADRELVARRAELDPALTSTLESHQLSDGLLVIRTATAIPLDWLPGAVRGRVSAGPTVTRTETWWQEADRRLAGDMSFTFTGVTATATGTMNVSEASDPSTTLFTQRLTLSVGIPLVGGMIEQAIARRIDAATEREVTFLDTL